jgi:cysteine desulfurase
MERIFLDHHATTPVLPEVAEAMSRWQTERFANPSSAVYIEGLEASRAVDRAREQVAALVGARASEVVFTSGATEANNAALKGAAWSRREGRDHLLTCAVEHKAVLEPVEWLRRQGVRVTVLPVDGVGRVDPGAVSEVVGESTFLVSIQWANGEVGTLQPVEEIGRVCRERGVLFHVDAAQALGKVEVDFGHYGADLISLSAHKSYGPKGIGALVVRRGVRIDPLLHGGGQERGRRSGTIHVAGAVGFGAACEIAARELTDLAARLRSLRDRLWGGIRTRIPRVRRNGDPDRALPNNLNVTFEGVYAQALIQGLRHVAVSSGSACSSSNPEPSYVLRALGLSDALADGALRFGLGRGNDERQVDSVVEALVREVERLRALAPVGAP